MLSRLWHRAEGRGRPRGCLAAPRTGASVGLGRAAVACAAGLAILMGALVMAAPAAQATSFESSYHMKGSLEALKEQIGKDGGSIDDLAEHLLVSPEPEVELDLDRYLADMASLDHYYGGSEATGDVLARLGISSDVHLAEYMEEHYEEGVTNEAAADEMREGVDHAIESSSSLTEELAGGELDDVAASAGIEPGVGAVVGAIALPATLAVADVVVIGHDIMEIESGGGKSQLEPEYAVGIEKMAWARVKPNSSYLEGAAESILAKVPFEGIWYAGPCWRGFSCPKELQPSVPVGSWVLEVVPEGGHEWWGALGAWEPKEAVEDWVNPSSYVSPNCTGTAFSFISSELYTAGWPSTLQTTHQHNVSGFHEEYGYAECTHYIPPECETCEGITRREQLWEYQVSTIKSRAGLHIRFPREATYSGGLPKQEPTLTPVTGVSPLETALPKLVEGLKSETHSSAEKVLDHGGHVHKSGEPETLPGYTVVPSCRTLSVSACESLMEADELETYTVTPLEWKTADLSVELEHVVKTEPAEGTEVETGKHIVIEPNPEAAEATKLAEALQTKNSGAELTSKDAKAIASRCLQDTALGGVEASKCESLPIFLSGSDVSSATEHDLRALGVHPTWVRLNYESAAAKEEKESREWYKGLGSCSGTAPAGDSCDEYPFFASQQGGGKAEIFPSLEWINKEDNSKQGGKYGNFVTSCGMAARSSTDYAFLAIPLDPALEIPTSRLCN